ncbi:OmpA family protein [Piscinibacter sakaiensis]|uniref:OmpA family protein n=1 Tax=Piscinibacter sakaiensis TaxID=1547922 RepID=UPI003726758B
MARQEAAALQQQLAQVQAQATDRGMLVTLGDVLFEFNRAEVKPSARDELAKVAQFLKEHPERRILVEGFTDNVGSAEYNQELSRKRAESVAAALVALGVPADRVTTAGYGKDHPVADNATDTNRAMNRRVEVYISNDARPVQPRRG